MSRADMIVLAGSEVVTMSSREVAEVTGKDHSHVMRDIRQLEAQLKGLFGGYIQTWIHPQNKQEYEEYILEKDTCLTLMTGYDAVARIKVVKRWRQLEAQAGDQVVPRTLPDALRLAADLAEKAQIAAAERDEAIRTKALIGSRREASAMGKASAAVREANKLRDQLGFNTRHATITAVENVTKGEYAWRPLRKWCDVHGVTPETIPDKRYGQVKAYPADAWGEVYGVDLVEVFSLEVAV